ncbi:Hypothetical predicted protein, partial [Paramuricea clavata]
EISAAAKLKEEKRKELNRFRGKHRRLDNKVGSLVKAIEDLNDIQNELVQPDSTDQ